MYKVIGDLKIDLIKLSIAHIIYEINERMRWNIKVTTPKTVGHKPLLNEFELYQFSKSCKRS